MTLLGIVGRDKQIIQFMVKYEETPLNCYEDGIITICTDAPLIANDDEVVVVDGEMLSPMHTSALTQGSMESTLLNTLDVLVVKWRKYSKELWLASDLFALRQLYYTVYEGNLIFSSNLESLIKALNIKKIDEENLKSYILYGFVPPPYTLFSKVFKLLPAELLYFNFEKSKVISSRYYSLNIQARTNIKLAEALSIVKTAVEEATRQAIFKRKAKYAILLSGGLDSPTIAAVARRYTQNIVAITLLNTGEGDIARRVSDYLNLPLIEVYVTEDEFLKALEPSFKCLQEPLAGIDIVPSTFLLLKQAKELGADVILTGDGGDKAFFGFPWVFKDEFKYTILKFFPKWCSITLKNLCKIARQYLPILHENISHLALENALSRRLNEDESFKHDEPIVRWYRKSYDTAAFDPHGVRRVKDIAHKFRLKTAHPFLNRNFIENLYLIPAKFKQPTIHETKYILRLYLLHENLLPKEAILLKRKTGLASNIWFSQTLINEYLKILIESGNPYVRLDFLKNAMKARDFYTLSALVGFSLWYKKYC